MLKSFLAVLAIVPFVAGAGEAQRKPAENAETNSISIDTAYKIIDLHCPDKGTIQFIKNADNYSAKTQIRDISVNSSGVITFSVERVVDGKGVSASLVIQGSAGCSVQYWKKPS